MPNKPDSKQKKAQETGKGAADIMAGLMQYLSMASPQASEAMPLPPPQNKVRKPYALPPQRLADPYLGMVSNEHWNKNYAFDNLDPMNPRGHAAAADAVQAYYPFAGASMIADALRQPVQAYEAAADQIRQNYPTDQQIYDMYRMGRYYNSAAPYDYMDSPYYTPGELE